MAGNSWLGGFYLLLNVASVSGLIFANKFVLTTLGFRFTYALSFLHTCATICGLQIFIFMGAFKPKKISGFQVLDLAAAFVGYLVLGNLSLQLNAVGFYQVMKVSVDYLLVSSDLFFQVKRVVNCFNISH